MTQASSSRSPRDADKPAANLLSLFRSGAGDALLAMMLASGGDERIALCADGRNPYFAPIRPATNEAWFASSTASAISPRGWRAAEAALPMAFSAAGAGLVRRIAAKAADRAGARGRRGRALRLRNPGRIYGAGLRAGLDGARPKKSATC